MSVVGADATQLRALADEVRTRAASLRADSTALSWNSGAAEAFRLQIDLTANDLGSSAAALDAAAAALDLHARQVGAAKALIAAAEAFAASVLDRAIEVATFTTEVVHEVVEGAVNNVMTVLSSVVAGPARIMTVLVHRFNGQDIPASTVTTARRIAGAVPSRPLPGSRDWLDVQNRFQAEGWNG